MENKFTVSKKAMFLLICLIGFFGLTFAQTTYTFSNYPEGVQYAENEVHELDDDVTIVTTQCHFKTELRVYSSNAHDGFFYTYALPLYIDSLSFNMGYKVDNVNIYGSTDGDSWNLVGTIAVTSTSYANYGISFGTSNYNFFKFDVAGTQQIRVKSLTIFYKSTGPAGNAASMPTFTPAQGIYNDHVNVSLSSTTTNASIYYTLDGTAPTTSSTLYEAPFTISQTTTVKAMATAEGYSNSPVASATYTIPEVVSDLAAFKAMPTGSQPYIIDNDVTFVFGSGQYTYVKDATAGLLLYGNSSIANAFTEGDQIANLMGSKSLYHNQVEMQDITYTESQAANTGTVEPLVLTMNQLLSDYDNYDAQLITLENVTFPYGYAGTDTATITQGSESMTLYKRFSFDTTITAGSVMNLTGFAAVNNNTIQIYPRNNHDFGGHEIVPTPSLTITAPANGSTFSTFDTLPIGIDIQNFTLGTDGFLKVETPLLTSIGLSNPAFADETGLSVLLQSVFSPLPAGTHTITCSLVDMEQAALDPAVSQSTTFTVIAPVLDAPAITAIGDEAEGDNTFYFNATVSMAAAEGASIHYTTDGTVPTEASELYSEPFQITATTTVKAIAVKEHYQNSDVTTLEVTITAPTVATPVFTPVSGTYADSVSFSLACETEGAEIRYTTDGSEPTETSTLYTEPVLLTATTTVKAKAFKETWFASQTATATYSVVYDPALTANVTAMFFSSTQLSNTFTVSGAHLDEAITLTCNNTHFTLDPTTINNPNSNTVVTVTFDGAEPTMSLITITSDTLSAEVSLVATAQLPAPVLEPATGEDTLITVTMSCAQSTAVIHYTINGDDPTAESETYTTPIVLNVPGTYAVKAIAVKTDWENSDIVTGTYVINEPPAPDTVNVPVITPASGLYYGPQTVTIACADSDAVIRYTTDGTEPTEVSTLYEAPFPVTTNTTITAKAWKSGMIPSGTASVTISFPEQVANIAEFKAAAATSVEKQIMSDVTFVFRSGRFMFVEDNTAALLIYDYNTPVITTEYNEGDVIEGGIFGKYTLYQGMVEMLPTHNAAEATGTPVTVTPTATTIADIKAQYQNVYEAKLVTLSDVHFITDKKFVQNGDTMAIFNRFNTVTTTVAPGDLVDVTGFVCYSTQHGYQIYPRGNEDIAIHTPVYTDTVATPVFDVYRSGEFYYVHLACATEGASIYYTFDGNDPNLTSYVFMSDFPLDLQPYTLKAIAMKEGMANSAIAVYDFNPNGVPAYDLRNSIRVYPNPAADFVNVESADMTIEKVELYNMYGQLLRTVEMTGNRTVVSVESLATGTYFAKVFTDNGVVTMPVIRK